MTRRELARLANVSVSTVSKAFNNADDISEETKNHIFAVARQYGCYGKFDKGRYPKKVIAVICPEFASNYYAAFIECFRELIEAEGGIAVISSDHFDQSKAGELIEYCTSYMKADGVIVLGWNGTLKKGSTTPLVWVLSESASVDSVRVKLENAVEDSVRLLTDYGHKKIAFLGERLTPSKAELFKRAMKRVGNSDICMIESQYRFEQAGEDGVRQLLAAHSGCTALVCAYDNIALGAIRELKRAGLRVPEDVSVVGFDNINTGHYTETTLTTIDTNPREVCMAAWDILKEKLKNPYFQSRKSIEIESRLIIRESVGRCRDCE